MNMPTPPQEKEASHERRRRQNRESQRRWRERYRQEKAEAKKKPEDASPKTTETPKPRTPSVPNAQSPTQSKDSPESQQLSGFFENTNLLPNQLDGRLDTHMPWSTEPFHFPLQPQGATNTYLDGSIDQTSLEYNTLPRIRDQFSQFPSVGTCGPTQLITPASSVAVSVSQSVNSDNQCRDRDIENGSSAEETIRDVQILYRIGVKAGFLKRDDKIKNYLAAMRRIYNKVPTLMDEDFEGPSGSDLDEWSD